MTNADRCYLRATTRTIERLISAIVSVADDAIDTYADTPAEQSLRKLHSKLGAIRACDDFDALRAAGQAE